MTGSILMADAHNLPDSLFQKLRNIEIATLGHFIENGFCNTELKPLNPDMRAIGYAKTVRLHDADAVAINRAILRLDKNDILVIDMGGNDQHACIGAVTRAAIASTGAAAVVVNGLVTDLDDLASPLGYSPPLPVFAIGATGRTTKILNSNTEIHGKSVQVAGVEICEGDIVLGDRNGILAASAETLREVVPLAQESDEREPQVLQAIASGQPLSEILDCGE